ncbi:MAG: flagellar biosynthesis protein FlhF [Burkholderiales bacterium]|nr:flagellar biosynthesis protein FlhF [Burkholderiales bacterium]
MSARKFTGATSREVLHKVKRALGDDALIIANHAVAEGVEVLAMPAAAFGAATAETMPVAAAAPQRVLPSAALRPAPAATDVRPPAPPAAERAAHPAVDGILSEIQRMRGLLQGELAALAVSDLQRRNPAATGILGELLCAGFSPVTARAVTASLPAGEPVEMLRRRVSAALERRLVTAASDGMIEGGGVFALVGPTGVGKTTTVAKLAARGVMRYGASGVALLTTDSYRIAAQDQLRVYGKILGVPVHPVKDAADLGTLLSELGDKRLVLIDTVGMSQRDRMVPGQTALLDAVPGVRRILMLNASSTVATLEEVVAAYAPGGHADCIISKVDEAAGLGPSLDICVRHGLTLHYMTNGQRVPEDIHPPNRTYLLHRALRGTVDNPALTPSPEELPLMMAAPAVAGAAHA